MNHAEKVARIKSMLLQVAPHHDLEALPGAVQPDIEFTEGLAQGPRAASALPAGAAEAGEAVRKLKENREGDISPLEAMGIEAIILPKIRPVAFVRQGTYDRMKAPWEWLDGSEIRNRINPLLSSVGRIEMPNQQSIPYGGTGFLVGPGLLMTNRHVARLFTDGIGRGTQLRYRPGDAGVDFRREAFTATTETRARRHHKIS
jgi:V8-like Glu-specific endopeptidase